MNRLGSKLSKEIFLALAVVAIVAIYALVLARLYDYIGFDFAMTTMIASGMIATLATLAYLLASFR